MNIDEESTTSSDWRLYADYWFKFTTLLILGLAISAYFVMFLSFAMAQKQVELNLQSLENSPALSDAYYLRDQSKESENKIAERETELSTEKVREQELARSVDEARAKKSGAQANFQAAATAANLREWCPEQFDQQPVNLFGMTEMLERIRACDELPNSERRDITRDVNAMRAAYGAFLTANGVLVRDEELLISSKAKIEGIDKGLQELRSQAQLAERIEPKFYPTDKLKLIFDNWSFLSFVFEIPPSILPIFMSFISGLFGALLINLILIVYPKNEQDVRRGWEFIQHVFLGGLIATAVFVVIGSGTTVLGFSNAGEGGANFLSFSALGLFSGMFSRQAAQWLDEKGETWGGTPAPTPATNPEAPPPAPIPAAPSL